MAETTTLPAKLEHIHLIGICGTGVGTLAGMLRARGYRVTGSDENSYPPMSTQLDEWGIRVLQGYHPHNLGAPGSGSAPDLVIIGNVCRRTNPECQAVESRGLPYLSMSRAIALFFLEGHHPIVVAGTHGKTTTTALIGHLLSHGGLDPSVLVGGVVADFEGSFRLGLGPHFVIEGDEYDSAYFDKGPKFLHYRPRHAVLTNVEFDHADIFEDDRAVDRAFRAFLELMPEDGLLMVCSDDERALCLALAHARCTLRGYGLGEEAGLRAVEIENDEHGLSFTLLRDGSEFFRMRTPLAGEHNLRNTLAALGVGLSLGLSIEELGQGLLSFKGVRKRQEILGEARQVMVIDDFAHHPTAVRETVRAVAARFPARTIWAVFEAKSNSSRLNVFQEDYARAFDKARHVIIARPFRKKEWIPPERRLDLPRLVRDLGSRGIDAMLIPEVEEIVEHLVERVRPQDLVLIMSGSSFGGIHDLLLDELGRSAAFSEEQ